jgi:hypothetical protein
MKVGQNIVFIDFSEELEDDPDRWKNMAASGRGIFLYMYIVKTCQHSRSHIFGPIFMKFCQNFCFLDTWVKFENGSGLLKNMVARGTWQFSLYLYSKKACKQSWIKVM